MTPSEVPTQLVSPNKKSQAVAGETPMEEEALEETDDEGEKEEEEVPLRLRSHDTNLAIRVPPLGAWSDSTSRKMGCSKWRTG